MASELLPAELGGIPLEIEHIEDAFENALVKHEFLFRNGAQLRTMGLKARQITFRAYFYGDTYEAHKSLLTMLETADSRRKLVHPVYGIIYGDVERVTCRHDDREQLAELDITFCEGLITDTEPTAKPSVSAAAQAAAVDGANKRASWLSDKISQFQKSYAKVKAKVTAFENKMTAATATFDNLMTEVSNPATTFTNLLNFTTNIGPSLVLSVAKATERYAVAYQTLKSTPAAFISKLSDSLRTLEASFAGFGDDTVVTSIAADLVRAVLKATCAEMLALAASELFEQEQTIRDAVSAAESAAVADGNGEFVSSENAQLGNTVDETDSTTVSTLMTVSELENVLATTRTYLQEAIVCARENDLDPQPYKDMALALEQHVNNIKLQRENIKEIELDQPMPLHVVCLRHGLPYRMAERLVPLNRGIQNPNKVEGTLDIYTEASNG